MNRSHDDEKWDTTAGCIIYAVFLAITMLGVVFGWMYFIREVILG